jgi:hypothetical protein
MDANVKNRTDYLKDFLDRDFGTSTLGSFIGLAAFVFWHAAAAPPHLPEHSSLFAGIIPR